MYCFPPSTETDYPWALVLPVEHEKKASELNGGQQDVLPVTMSDIETKLKHITNMNGNIFVYAGSFTCQDPVHWWLEQADKEVNEEANEEANNNATAPAAGEDGVVDDPEHVGEDVDGDEIEQEQDVVI